VNKDFQMGESSILNDRSRSNGLTTCTWAYPKSSVALKQTWAVVTSLMTSLVLRMLTSV